MGDLRFPARCVNLSLGRLFQLGSEEERGYRGDLTPIDRKVDRKVMAFDSPTPLARLRRFPKDAYEIPIGIADHCPILFQFLQNPFQAHDRDRLIVAGLAHAGAEQFEPSFF